MSNTTTYTGTIRDLSGAVVTGGQVLFTLTPGVDATISGLARFVPTVLVFVIASDGSIKTAAGGPCAVTKNTALSPPGTCYRIEIQPYFKSPGSILYDYATDDTRDISTVAPALPQGPVNYGGVTGPPGPVSTTTANGTNGGFYALGEIRAPQINGAYFVDRYSSVDLVTQINAIIAATGGDCVISIPPGTYVVTTGTIVMRCFKTVILGAGANSTIINYAGSLFLDCHMDAANWGASYGGSASIGGFQVNASAAASVGFFVGSILNLTMHDIHYNGPSGAVSIGDEGTSEGFKLQNNLLGPQNWCERLTLRNVVIAGVSKLVHTVAPTNDGTDSFGYALFDGIWANLGSGCVGFQIDAGTQLYNMLGFRAQINSGGTTLADEVFRVGGYLTGCGFAITGENAGSPIRLAHILDGGYFVAEGGIRTFGPQTVSDGGILVDNPTANQSCSFYVGPWSGLGGVLASVGSTASKANFAGSGTPVGVYPTERLSRNNPFLTAYTGFVVSQDSTGWSAPICVLDPRGRAAIATAAVYYAGRDLGDFVEIAWINGDDGSVVLTGGLQLGGPLVGAMVTPASSTAPGVVGQICWDASYVYVCTATNAWKRTAIATW